MSNCKRKDRWSLQLKWRSLPNRDACAHEALRPLSGIRRRWWRRWLARLFYLKLVGKRGTADWDSWSPILSAGAREWMGRPATGQLYSDLYSDRFLLRYSG